jgi:predicted ATPase/DNA-binding SARP family transcriptional activator
VLYREDQVVAGVKIRLLGTFDVRRHENPITDMGGDQVRALLAYLAVEPRRPHRRDRLAGLLWAEETQSTALRNLRTALYRLRRALGDHVAQPPYLLISHDSLQLHPNAAIEVDVARFTALIAASRSHSHASGEACAECISRLSEAARLYGGDFLPGFALDSPLFEEWLVIQREGLHQQALWTLERLAAHHETEGEYEQALLYARRQIALEPWREQAHRQVMRALALSGQRAAALAQFATCQQILDAELSIGPDARTRDLYERIRAETLQPAGIGEPNVLGAREVAESATPKRSDGTRDTPAPAEARLPGDGALTAAEKAPPAFEGERRWVTVVIADVGDAEARGAPPDPEAWAETLEPAMQILLWELERLGAEVQRPKPDTISAYFGLVAAQEDDPERAVVAALAMQGAFEAYREEVGAPSLGLRITVHTGVAIINTLSGAPAPMGKDLAEAEQLHNDGSLGEVRVSESTYRLVGPIFTWEHAAGVHRPVGQTPSVDKGRGLHGLNAPLVGRDRELQALLEAIDQLGAGVGGIVTIVGEAGIGKSRLVAEGRKVNRREGEADRLTPTAPVDLWPEVASRQLPPDSPVPSLHWVEGRCLSYATQAAYQIWGDVVRALIGVSPAATPVAVREALYRVVEASCADRCDDVYPLLAWLLALPLDDTARIRVHGLDPQGLRVLALQAIQMLLEHITSQAPLVITLEDLHWADSASLELLEELLPLTERSAVLFICVMRPETEHGCWHIRELAGRDYYHRHTDIRLAALSAEQSRDLVGHLLTVEDLPDRLRQRVLTHAEGNPFFLEEILRALIDDGAIVREEPTGRWQATGDVTYLRIPPTVHGVIASRIDRLPPEARRILQLAAVIGRFVPVPLLATLAGPEGLEERLQPLQHADLLRERTRLPEAEVVFKHQLTLETAYDSLLTRKRRTLHGRVAEALEQLYPDRLEGLLGLVAHHWEEAGDTERALHYLQRAGEQAASRYANAEAIGYFTRALALLPEEESDRRFALLLARGWIYTVQGNPVLLRTDLDALAELAERPSGNLQERARRQAQVAIRESTYYRDIADMSQAQLAARRAIVQAEIAGDVALQAKGYVELLWSVPEEGLTLEMLERALALARSSDQVRAAADGHLILGTWHRRAGDHAAKHRHFEAALQLSQESGDRDLQAIVLGMLGGNVYWTAEEQLDLAESYARQALQLHRETGNRFHQTVMLYLLGLIEESRGHYAKAREHWLISLEAGHKGRFASLAQTVLAAIGDVSAALGAWDVAGSCYAEASEQVYSDRAGLFAFRHLASLAHKLGDDAAALEHCRQAIARSFTSEFLGVYLYRGHALARLGHTAGAVEAYRHSIYLHIEHPEREYPLISTAMEAMAGLAQLLLVEQGLAEALSEVAPILQRLETHPDLIGCRDPHFVYLVAYRVLAAAKDPRAKNVLAAAHRLLMDHVALIDDEATRRTFIENVPVNRELRDLWAQQQS